MPHYHRHSHKFEFQGNECKTSVNCTVPFSYFGLLSIALKGANWGWLRIHEMKVSFHEEGTVLYYHNIHDLAWWWWKVTVMDRNEVAIQSNKSHVVQVSSVWNKLWLEIKWNTSLSGHPTWKINVLTHTLQRSKLPLPFKKFLLFEHHNLLNCFTVHFSIQ